MCSGGEFGCGFEEEGVDDGEGEFLPDFEDLVHVVDPLVLVLVEFGGDLARDLLLETLELLVVLEDGEHALLADDSLDPRAGLGHDLHGAREVAGAVVLLEGEGEFAGTDGAAAVHEGVEGLGLDDELVEAVEHRLHVHDLQVALEGQELHPLPPQLRPPLRRPHPHRPRHALHHHCPLALRLDPPPVVLLHLPPVGLEHLLGQHQLVLVDLEVEVADESEDFAGVGVDLLVELGEELRGRLEERGQLDLQEVEDVLVADLPELEGRLDERLEAAQQSPAHVDLLHHFAHQHLLDHLLQLLRTLPQRPQSVPHRLRLHRLRLVTSDLHRGVVEVPHFPLPCLPLPCLSLPRLLLGERLAEVGVVVDLLAQLAVAVGLEAAQTAVAVSLGRVRREGGRGGGEDESGLLQVLGGLEEERLVAGWGQVDIEAFEVDLLEESLEEEGVSRVAPAHPGGVPAQLSSYLFGGQTVCLHLEDVLLELDHAALVLLLQLGDAAEFSLQAALQLSHRRPGSLLSHICLSGPPLRSFPQQVVLLKKCPLHLLEHSQRHAFLVLIHGRLLGGGRGLIGELCAAEVVQVVVDLVLCELVAVAEEVDHKLQLSRGQRRRTLPPQLHRPHLVQRLAARLPQQFLGGLQFAAQLIRELQTTCNFIDVEPNGFSMGVVCGPAYFEGAFELPLGVGLLALAHPQLLLPQRCLPLHEVAVVLVVLAHHLEGLVVAPRPLDESGSGGSAAQGGERSGWGCGGRRRGQTGVREPDVVFFGYRLLDIQSQNFLEGGGLLAVLAVAAAGAQFGGTDGAVGVGRGVGEGAAEFAFGAGVGAFAGGVAAVVVDLIDQGVQVLERVEFFIAGGLSLAGLLFGRGLGFGGGQRAGSFHNVTILMILLKEESRPPAIIIVSKLMPKWEVNLRPNPSNLQVQRQYEQLAEPFGFTTDTTAPSVQLPRRRDMLQSKLFDVATANKSQILMTVFMFWMFGNNITIFVLFPIIQTLTSAVGGLLKLSQVFAQYEGMLPSLAKYKIMYVGIHLILLSIVLYKLSAMGLLPVSAADYVDLVPPLDTFRVISHA